MKAKSRIKLLFAVFMAFFLMNISIIYADSAEDILPKVSTNTYCYKLKKSALIVVSDGYERVFYDANTTMIYLEKYDKDFAIISRKTITPELTQYGGFFNGTDAYYFIFGDNNLDEEDSKEVYRIVKYDKNWNRIGAASITGDSRFAHEVRYPFDYGNVSCAEVNGTLYVVTGHEGYVDPKYNQGHQGFMMLAVDESKMIGKIVDADLWHSFSQHITIVDSDHIYTIEESEGDECAKLTLRTESNINGKAISILKYGGERTSAWAVATYATANAISHSKTHILTLGTSIDQDRYDDSTYTKSYNVYLTATPIDDFSADATTFTWINAANSTRGYKEPKLTKINDNRFMISWENASEQNDQVDDDNYDILNSHILHYIFVDGTGKVISSEYTAKMPMSECEPIVDGDYVVSYAAEQSVIAFYKINSKTGAFSKKTYRLSGPTSVWSYEDGILTISGTGEMAYSLGSSMASSIKNSITKIVVGEGITSLCDSAFYGYSSVETISLPRTLQHIGNKAMADLESLVDIYLPYGLKTIGDYAFAYSKSIRNVYCPDTLTSIGDEIVFTGWYWTGSGNHVYYATLHCNDNSTAYNYAVENKQYYKLFTDVDDFVNPVPVIKTQPVSLYDVQVEDAAAFEIKVAGYNLTYQWQYSSDGKTWKDSKIASAKTSKYTFNTIAEDNNLYIRCIAKNSYGSVTSNVVRLTVKNTPVITTQPQSKTVNVTDNVSFSVTAKGSKLTYQWQYCHDGKTWKDSGIASAKTNTYTFSATTEDNNLYVRCIVKTPTESVISDSVKLTVTNKPVILKQPQTQAVGVAQNVSFTVNAAATGLSYQWQWSYDGKTWNSSSSASAKTNTYSFKTSLGDNNLLVRCIVKNTSGSATSSVAKLTVTNKPIITKQPINQTVNISGKASFAVTASGSGLSYQWQWSYDKTTWHNSGIAAAKTNNYTFTASSSDNNLYIRCIVKNASGQTISDIVKLQVMNPPVILNHPQSQIVSLSGKASFSVNASGSSLTYQWQWSYDGKEWHNSGLSSAKTSTYSFTASKGDNGLLIRCIIKNSLGTVTSNTVKLTVK